MLNFKTTHCLSLLAAAAIGLSANNLFAQVNPAATKAALDAAKDPKAADPLATHPSVLEAHESEMRAKVLSDPKWKEVDAMFQKWLVTQPIYSDAEIKRMTNRMIAQRDAMSASELQEFLDDWDTKLKILLGKDAQEAQQWLGVYMANMADGYRRSYLKRMGLDKPGTLTAAQLEQEIVRIRASQKNLDAYAANYQHSSDQRFQAAQNQKASAMQERQFEQNATLGGNYGDSGFQSGYSPWNPPATRLDIGGWRGW